MWASCHVVATGAGNLPRGARRLVLLSILALGYGCKQSKQEVVAYTSVDQVFAEPVLRSCEAAAGGQLRGLFDTEETKSTGVVNRLLAEAANPRADVFWSGDPVRPFLLIERGLIQPYRSAAASRIPASFRGADGMWTGFAARARVLLVNTQLVSDANVPGSIRDLSLERWKGRVAMANPLFGTTTMHVAALFAAWGEAEAKVFLQQLRTNELRVASSNGEVKRLVVAGEVAFGVTDTDDAHEAVSSGAPVRVVYPDQDALGTLVMPGAVVLLAGAPNPERGRRLIDCLLSPEVEQRMAENGAHMPLQTGVRRPDGVREVREIRAMQVDYARVAQVMTEIQPWLREWVGL